ncbi:J domain-containing protein [Hymenobacter sp. BT683]|uniref:J domain-containing protein n=1 Tax=Hymenobacter jeongseonensis TaxID=2791027 RepID=A0ABS0IDD0_9BACT|nr:J domain-containing protein [Hymenobacter jeongseonensis]MBF9236358.1 J domain-containing protein [Hymenobacter jeongseonensis]
MTHYQVLEVPTTAKLADIRRAYRRLVFLTHPDRTPDPEAHARYYAVTAAYEVLSNPSRRVAYDAGIRPPAVTHITPSGRARDAAHRAFWSSRPKPAAVPPTVRYAAQYAQALRLARPLLVACLLLCGTLAVDYFLATEQQEKVLRTETTFYSTRRGSYQKTLHQTDRGTFTLYNDLPVGARVPVRRTPLWGTPISVRSSPQQLPFAISSIYEGARNVFWLGLLATATLGLLPRLNKDYRLGACMLAAVFLALTLLKMLL